MKINTALFDLDGTLINTNELIIASYLHTLDKFFPEQYNREHIIPLMGMPLTETMEHFDKNQVKELIETYKDHNLSHHDELVTEFEGVIETIETLHKNGYKLGIVTTKMRRSVNLGLKLAGLDCYFDTIVTLDDVERAKPDAEPVEKALALLNAKPEEAIMIGDSKYDILSGKNAGTKTAGVAWTIRGREYLEEFSPDYMLDEMTDLLAILGEK
ncbi:MULTISPECIES: pyrophosphatase PpaX [unclassified Fictibacillus]|uniref:pyrophosphatase PpaX n=1 Tax=unclassified Fictibacillus TaxID=2644029 RepID=UPI00078557AA|nr:MULTISPECIES: pyrophosphatase PpaX [unclassified Fictibacillus]MED2971644.1 pyrophosphatase PpaX [Fictibacillus sp. B-59209]UZJ79779.1 pyrophosphatase PpaX [Fictibacillus sp. KU28468]